MLAAWCKPWAWCKTLANTTAGLCFMNPICFIEYLHSYVYAYGDLCPYTVIFTSGLYTANSVVSAGTFSLTQDRKGSQGEQWLTDWSKIFQNTTHSHVQMNRAVKPPGSCEIKIYRFIRENFGGLKFHSPMFSITNVSCYNNHDFFDTL